MLRRVPVLFASIKSLTGLHSGYKNAVFRAQSPTAQAAEAVGPRRPRSAHFCPLWVTVISGPASFEAHGSIKP